MTSHERHEQAKRNLPPNGFYVWVCYMKDGVRQAKPTVIKPVMVAAGCVYDASSTAHPIVYDCGDFLPLMKAGNALDAGGNS